MRPYTANLGGRGGKSTGIRGMTNVLSAGNLINTNNSNSISTTAGLMGASKVKGNFKRKIRPMTGNNAKMKRRDGLLSPQNQDTKSYFRNIFNDKLSKNRPESSSTKQSMAIHFDFQRLKNKVVSTNYLNQV